MSDERWESDVLILGSADAHRLLSLDVAIEAVEVAYAAQSSGAAELFPVALQELAEPEALFVVKGAIWPAEDATGLKLVNYRATNVARGLDNHQAVMVLCDATSGRLRAVLDGNAITTQRTVAAGALAIRRLARPDAGVIAVLGSGLQARAQLTGALHVRPGLAEIRLWGRDGAKTRELAASLGGQQSVDVLDDPREAVRGADIVVTCTASRSPLFEAADVSPGTHVNAIGSDTADKRELPIALVEQATLVVDDVDQSRRLGESKPPVHLDAAPPTIGEVVLSQHPGRTRDDEITVFDSTGIGLQDITSALALYRLAARMRAGTWTPWL